MGILSKVVGTAVKAVKTVAKTVSKAVSGTGGGSSSGSIWSKVKNGVKSAASKVAGKNSFVSRAFKGLTKGSGKTSILRSIGKGLSKALKVGTKLCKKIPVIGAALTVLVEIPTLYKAYKKDGWSGVGNQLKGVGVELGCTLAGAAVGCLAGPPGIAIGAIIGGVGGWYLRDKYFPEPDDEDEGKNSEIQQEPEQTPEEPSKKQEERPSNLPEKPDNPYYPQPPENPELPINPKNPETPEQPVYPIRGLPERPDRTPDNIIIQDKADIKDLIIPPETYTQEEVKKLMSFGLSRAQILQLIRNGNTYHDIEMALLYEMIEDNKISPETGNPYKENEKLKSFRLIC